MNKERLKKILDGFLQVYEALGIELNIHKNEWTELEHLRLEKFDEFIRNNNIEVGFDIYELDDVMEGIYYYLNPELKIENERNRLKNEYEEKLKELNEKYREVNDET